jgi:hypothetical protein
MTPSEFVRSIYLGDRACKGVVVDSWAAEVKIRVDCISRVRGETWNFYNAENLDDGFLVFEDVKKIEWDPKGLLPNDEIEFSSVEPTTDGAFIFEIAAVSVDKNTGKYTPMTIRIHAKAISLEAQNGGPRIRD